MTKWKKYLNVVHDQILSFRRVNAEAFLNNTVDWKELNATVKTFEHRCQSHLYYRYFYHYKIINLAKEKTVERLKAFWALSGDLQDLSQSFSMIVGSVSSQVRNFKSQSGKRLSQAIQHAIQYIQDNTFQKYE
jgi:hypothetical protein